MMRLLILSACLALAACSEDPKVTNCLLNGDKRPEAHCSDDTHKKHGELLNYFCLPPSDYAGLLSCKQSKLTTCIVGAHSLSCEDPKGKKSKICFEEAKGYACITPADYLDLHELCKWPLE